MASSGRAWCVSNQAKYSPMATGTRARVSSRVPLIERQPGRSKTHAVTLSGRVSMPMRYLLIFVPFFSGGRATHHRPAELALQQAAYLRFAFASAAVASYAVVVVTTAAAVHGDAAGARHLLDAVWRQQVVALLDLVLRTRDLEDQRVRRDVDHIGAENLRDL